MANLIKKIQNTIFRQELFGRGDKIVVAVSGGPDSVCLLDVLVKLVSKYNLELIVAHVNYHLRGKDSDEDEEFVRGLAEEYGLKIIVKTGFNPVFTGVNISENKLRDVRYEFFEKIRKKNKFDFITVAHNADDQVETFLMRIIRGSGLNGMAGMKYKNGKIVRPLLAISRQEILKYLKENKLKYRIDKTNLESKFVRNKIRNKLLPYLEKNFNPKIRQTIFDATENIAEDYDFISEQTNKKTSKLTNLHVSKLTRLHPAMQKNVLRQIIKNKKGDLKDINAANLEEIFKIIKSTKNKSQIVIIPGLKIVRKGDKLTISRKFSK